jgi:hypothetical protein
MTSGACCHWHCWLMVCGTIDTADQWWAVLITPLKGGVNDTADQWQAVLMTSLTTGWRCQLHRPSVLAPLTKGTPLEQVCCFRNINKNHTYPNCITRFFMNFFCQSCHWHRRPQNQRFEIRLFRRIWIYIQKGFNPYRCFRGPDKKKQR